MHSRGKVIVVEDEPIIAQHIGVVLEDAGYEVVALIADAEEALLVVERESPFAAIVDVALVGAIDGVTLGSELTDHYGVQVVYVTGYPLSVCRQAWHLKDQVLSKPFSDLELIRAVDRVNVCDHPGDAF